MLFQGNIGSLIRSAALFDIDGLIVRDKPALIVEENYDSNKIMKLLKRFSYKGYYYSISKRKFELKRNKGALNRYYLQDKHLKI